MIIAGRSISADHPPYVIAECGLNHSGNVQVAMDMIAEAALAGADACKFQTHEADEFSDTPAYPGNANGESIQDLVGRCAISEADEVMLFDYAKHIGITYLSTPFSPLAVARLERIGVPGYKVGSGDNRNLPLLRLIAATGKPVIISTGMCEMHNVRDAVNVFYAYDRSDIALLGCTSEYPTVYEHVRLGALDELRLLSSNVGLSCHSRGIWTALGAVALGSVILEKHFKIPSCPPGPDVDLSIKPQELADLVVGSRAIWQARGGIRTALAGELETKAWFEKSRRA